MTRRTALGEASFNIRRVAVRIKGKLHPSVTILNNIVLIFKRNIMSDYKIMGVTIGALQKKKKNFRDMD